ncbi:unnamed protein product, partial [Rotaria sp. Silwood1]
CGGCRGGGCGRCGGGYDLCCGSCGLYCGRCCDGCGGSSCRCFSAQHSYNIFQWRMFAVQINVIIHNTTYENVATWDALWACIYR